MGITRVDAERLLVDKRFGMDPYFPEHAECSREHAAYMLKVVWPLLAQYRKVLVAQSAMATYTTIGMFAVGDRDLNHLGAGHVFYIDYPGKGKTILAKVPGVVIGAGARRFQGMADALPSDYTGNRIIQIDEKGRRYFELVKGPGFAHIQLLDEFNRNSPRAQSAVLEAIGEGTITVGNETHTVSPFAIITANPIESGGTHKLGEAFLDRIMFQVIGEPFVASDFSEIICRTRAYSNVTLECVCDIETIREVRQFFHETVHTPDDIVRTIGHFCEIINDPARFGYLTDLAEVFGGPIIRQGISGRGAVHLEGAARALAAIRYRNYVTPDDVYKVLLPVLRHRVIFYPGVLNSFRAEWDHDTTLTTADTIIRRLIRDAWGAHADA